MRRASPDIAEEFDQYHYQYPVSNGWGDEQVGAAKTAIETLRRGLCDGEIAARGIFNGAGLPTDIDATEFCSGYFPIWKQTLDCTIPGHAKRIFYSVIVNRKDVEALAQGMVSNSGAAPSDRWRARRTRESALETSSARHGAV